MAKREFNSLNPDDYANKWTQVFTNGETREEREAWLEQALEKAQLSRTQLLCRETAEGYEFGFDRYEDYVAFVFNTYGDLYSKASHSQTIHFDAPDKYWLRAAGMYLKAMGIECDLEIHGNSLTFKFDRFSESAGFKMMVDSGEIRRVADKLEKYDAFFKRVSPDNTSGFDRNTFNL